MAKKPGWYEKKQHVVTSRGIQTKAPEHYKASINKKLEDTLRVPLVKSKWTENTILEELQRLKSELGHFPKDVQMKTIGKAGISDAVSKHGGINYFREQLGEEIIQQSVGYWTEEKIFEELKKFITNIGHFPIQKELVENSGTNRFISGNIQTWWQQLL